MALVSIKKNEVRVSLIHFHREVISYLELNGMPRFKELQGEIDCMEKKIKQEMRDSMNKHAIRKAINEASRNVLSCARNSQVGSKVKSRKLFNCYFGGIVLPNPSYEESIYDVVIEVEHNTVVGWIFATSKQESVNIEEIKSQIETDFNKVCTRTEIKYPLHEINEPILFDFKNQIDNTKPVSDIANQENEEIIEEVANYDIIGGVLHDKRHQMLLKENRAQDQVYGFIKEAFAHTVSPNDILVLESENEDVKVFASVTKVETNPVHLATYEKSFSGLGVDVVFRPLLEKTVDYEGPLRPRDLSGYQIRDPTPKEFAFVTGVSSKGLPLGKLALRRGSLDCYFPFDTNSSTLHDTLYQSVMIAGVQGSGKTNFLKYLIQTVTSYSGTDYDKRPAVIILDGENQFKRFVSKDMMSYETREFLIKHGISDVKPQVLTISDKAEYADSTLSLKSLSYDHLIYLIPELESKTESILLSILKFTYDNLLKKKLAITLSNIRNEALEVSRNSSLIHQSQRPAIARALYSIELEMLDQENKTELTPELLFQPGKVTVIDIQNLDASKKRVVALYLLQMLNKFKMDRPNRYPGVILTLDEAELLFPNKPSKREKDYVERIAERVEDITNRGRKRYYGVFIVTHLPTEISPKVVKLAATKVAFKCAGANSWINEIFGREYVSEINNLPTGTCRIKVNISTNEQKVINTKLKVLHVG